MNQKYYVWRKKIVSILTIVILLSFGFISTVYSDDFKIALVGTQTYYSYLNNEERAAYDWAMDNYDAIYIHFDEILSNPSILDDIDVIWWHYDESMSIPVLAINAELINTILSFVSKGGGLFLSGFAPQYVVDLGVESNPPQEIRRGPGTSGEWGFYQMITSHPIFDGLENPFATLSAGLQVDNNICWWTDPNQYDGVWLTDLEWTPVHIVSSGEYFYGNGKILFVGAGAYEWHIESGENTNVQNLWKYTDNILKYLKPTEEIYIGVLGHSETYQDLHPESRAAYDWVYTEFNVTYINFSDLRNGSTQLSQFDVLWWHYAYQVEVPQDAIDTEVLETINQYVESGKGLLLSGLATQYVVTLGIETNEPNEISQDTTVSDVGGFVQYNIAHPVFNELSNPFETIPSGYNIVKNIAWWTDLSEFSGRKIGGDIINGDNTLSVGEYFIDAGRVIVIGSPGFTWDIDHGDQEKYSNLRKFSTNIINYLHLSRKVIENGLFIDLKFDEGIGSRTYNQVTDDEIFIHNNFDRPEWQQGVQGTALRLDGYSTYLSVSVPGEVTPLDELSIEFWTAVEAYPVSNAPFVNHYTFPGSGYFLGMDRLGNWYFAVSIDGEWYTYWADSVFPKNKWVHVGGTFNKETGITLYLNGVVVGTETTTNKPITPELDHRLIVGRDIHTPFTANIFPTGMINGLIDEIRIYNRILTEDEIYSSYTMVGTPGEPILEIPPQRFADDIHRPRYHALPPANWTNEPHGLVEWNNRYHMFYQHNPNGPYWAQIHWGHMSSPNLVYWDHHPIALAPELSYDLHGVWSGDCVIDGSIPTIVYTGVDGVRASMNIARSFDGMNTWEKETNNPVIPNSPPGYMDFRDPYLWNENNQWYMLIGAGIDNLGGVAHLYKSSNMMEWDYLGEFMAGNKENSGIFWEMPVFIPLDDDNYLFGVTEVPGRNSYWIGEWKNEKFTPHATEPKRLEIINHFLSPTITMDDDGRIVAIGIIPETRNSREQLNAGWAHVFSLPRIWYLHENGDLGQKPAPELQTLRSSHYQLSDIELTHGGTDYLQNIHGRRLEIIVEIDPGDSQRIGLITHRSPDGQERTRIYYDIQNKTINLDRYNSSLNPNVVTDQQSGPFDLGNEEVLKLHVFIDHSVIEVFANDRATFSTRVYPTLAQSEYLDLFSIGGTAYVKNIHVWEMEPIWDYPTSIKKNRDMTLPGTILLEQNFPNPFNPNTTIQFTMQDRGAISLIIYDVMGREVARLIDNEEYAQGFHHVIWNGSNHVGNRLASGVYFYRLIKGNIAETKRMLLLR